MTPRDVLRGEITPRKTTVVLTDAEKRQVSAATPSRSSVLMEIPDFKLEYNSVTETNRLMAKKRARQKKKGSGHVVQGGLPELGKRR
jgi:hypothetical protein